MREPERDAEQTLRWTTSLVTVYLLSESVRWRAPRLTRVTRTQALLTKTGANFFPAYCIPMGGTIIALRVKTLMYKT